MLLIFPELPFRILCGHLRCSEEILHFLGLFYVSGILGCCRTFPHWPDFQVLKVCDNDQEAGDKDRRRGHTFRCMDE